MSAIIALSAGKYAVVDEDDLCVIKDHKWHINSNGYAKTTTKNGDVYMHRLIMEAKENEEVDHIDGNPLNNTRANLRICSRNQNMWNTCKTKKNTSGYKNIHYERFSGRYKVSFTHNGKHIHIGRYKNLVDAIIARNKSLISLRSGFSDRVFEGECEHE